MILDIALDKRQHFEVHYVERILSTKIDTDAVKVLSKTLKEECLSELEYETKDFRIRVVSGYAAKQVAQPVEHFVAATPEHTTNSCTENHPGVIKSPMVGTVYLSPGPGQSSFIKVGDFVEEGQTLLIIEAMKVMNTIKAPTSGTIKKILVKDTLPVEFGEPMLIIESNV